MVNKGFDAFTLKMIAIAGMIVQHSAIAFADVIPLPLQIPMHVAGGFTFPIMAFFVVEGYRLTRSLNKYLQRMFVFGLLSQVPFMWVFDITIAWPGLNIMFTLFFGVLSLLLYDKIKQRWLFWAIFAVYAVISYLIVDLGFIGPITIILYYTIKNEAVRRVAPPVIMGGVSLIAGISVIALGGAEAEPALSPLLTMLDFRQGVDLFVLGNMTAAFAAGMFAPAFLLRKYNGERGRRMKYLFYAAYPVHLLILALAAAAFGLGSLNLL